MEKAALAQEKVWFDKPSYDKAERLYFERMAKVVSRKIMESCSLKSELSITDNCQDIINSNSLSKPKSDKSEKSKDNKSSILENQSNDIIKNSKCQTKNLKIHKDEDDCNIQKKETVDEKEKHDGVKNDVKEKENNLLNDVAKKCNAKEVKEKKNKADTRRGNRGKGKNDTKGVKENMTPLLKNKEQVPTQGNQQTTSPILPAGGSLASEVAKARQHIKQSLQCMDDIAAVAGFSTQNVVDAKKETFDLEYVSRTLKRSVEELEGRVKVLEDAVNVLCSKVAICPAKPTTATTTTTTTTAAAPKQPSVKDEDDEDVDLFGSDSEGEDAEAAKIREERLAAYNAKKSKKPALIAKSNIILDVKPWDDETDMKAMEVEVRKIETDGLLWGAAKLVPLAFGIHKLQISCVVEDDKVSVDWLTEEIQRIEDFVQSVDIAAFNKV